MKKIVMPLLIIVSLLSVIIMPSQGQAATTLDEINKKLKQLADKKNKAEKDANFAKSQINKIQRDKEQAENSLAAILDQIEEAERQIKQLTKQIDQITGELQQAGEQLEEAQDRVAARDSLLRSRLRLMYSNGIVSYMDVLLSSTDFSDFLDRYQALKSIVSQDKDILLANQKDRDMIEEKKIEIEQNLSNVEALYAKAEEYNSQLLKKENDKEVLIASLGDKEREYEHISEEQEKLIMDFAKEASKLQAEKRKIQLSYYNGGKLGYPLPDLFRISSVFGPRIDPITGKRGATHRGVDFAAPNGTSILAAESGVVIVAAKWNGYGNTVILDHGNGLWTLYAHIRPGGIKVEEGDTVKKGQKIAEVGSTGRSTGYHLHFEVRRNEEAVDPMKYLK